MTRLYGTGGFTGSPLSIRVPYATYFAAKGIMQRYDMKSANITRGDVSGTQRVSQIDPVTGSGALTQGTDARKPEYIAGAFNGGYLDVIRFVRGRGDRMAAPDFTSASFGLCVVGIVRTMGVATVNGILHGTNISGAGRCSVYLRENTLGVPLLSAYIGTTSFDASISINVPIDIPVALYVSWDATTRSLRVGYRALSAPSITWSSENIGEDTTAITQTTSIGVGANTSFSDACSFDLAALLRFTGYPIYGDSDFIDALNAYTHGPDSICNL